MLCSHGGQGYGEGSSWTRGQGWGIYGFMISYRHTHKTEYLDAAKRVAHYFMANIPEDGRIPIDFRMPAEPWYEGYQTAAITERWVLLEIARSSGIGEKGLYRRSLAASAASCGGSLRLGYADGWNPAKVLQFLFRA